MKTVLANGPAEKVVRDVVVDVNAEDIGQSRQFAAFVNRVVGHCQIGRHFIVPPPPPLAAKIWIGRFKYKALLLVRPVIAYEKTGIVSGECVQN